MTATSVQIALVILCIVFGGAMLGVLLGRRLPPHHMSAETRSVVSVSMAVVGTMSALVIGLLISSANTSFSARNGDVARLSMNIVRLDTLLRRYGGDADAARAALRVYATAKYDDLFPVRPGQRPNVGNPATAEALDQAEDLILRLRPSDDRQGWLRTQALQVVAEISEARSLLIQQNVSSVPLPFLGAVVLWLTVLFASFGLFAPRNTTAMVAMFLCALAVASALKLVLDMDTPFEGSIRLTRPPIRISSQPMANALGSLRH